MRYTSFTIKNYKGIKALTIDLEKQPKSNIYTLVGLNESGKTTILEAISLLELQDLNIEHHKLIPKSLLTNFDGEVSVTATLSLDDNDNEHLRKFAINNLGLRSLDRVENFEKTVKFNFQKSELVLEDDYRSYSFIVIGLQKGKQNKTFFDRKTEEHQLILGQVLDYLKPSIIYYPNFLFDFPKRIYLEAFSSEKKEQAAYRKVVGDIMDSLGKDLNIRDHIVDRMNSEEDAAKEALNSTIDEISGQITKTVFSAWGELFDAKGKQIVLKTDKEKIDGRNICYVELALKDGITRYSISERSLGFKWFFTFLLFTEFRKNRSDENGEILFLLDEPASNLHSTAQKKLLNTFARLIEHCKMIYTTHSHHLINPEWLAGAYIIRNKALNYERDFEFDSAHTDVEAVIYKQFIVEYPDQRTYFQPILDSIEYQPSSLEEVDDIVIVEGKNDYYTFRYVNDVVLEKKYPDVNIYPGTGADHIRQTIALYLAWGRDFLVLLDGDKPGEDAKRRYLKDFGRAVESNVITLRDVDATYSFATEELFTEAERLEIVQYFDATATAYDKGKFNTGLQNLFVDQQKIELSAETVKRFEKVFQLLTPKA